MPDPTAAARIPEQTSVKETLISITIAFAMAFVFRAFVIEAYVIPTGSMAPTLMGQHMRFQSPETGYQWAVNPWYYAPSGPSPDPLPVQAPKGAINPNTRRPFEPIRVTDPISGALLERTDVQRRAGDRILVLKYLHHLFDPSRFDVVVFKCPYDPQTNFIKRLIGLPGEQLALVDGDVFTRTPTPADPTGPDVDTWSLGGWQIDRKPERVQREVWQPVFDSEWTPDKPAKDLRTWFTSPWNGGGDAAWKIDGRRSYRHEGSGQARLDWQSDTFHMDDRYPYNEGTPQDRGDRFPVSDVRLSLGVEPDAPGLTVSAVVKARHHEFRAMISGAAASLQMRGADDSDWKTLATGDLPAPIPAGRVTNIEFWHVDQSLRLWVDGKPVASGVYDWTPAERILASTGMSIAEALTRPSRTDNVFEDVGLYGPPEPRWEFSGGPFTIHRVALARDLHYRAATYAGGSGDKPHSHSGDPARATHPYSTPTLTDTQFFVCGDNSPASFDARLWDKPDPYVARDIDPTAGVVPRALMLGKAFFVYFPSTTSIFGYRVLPDFGRLRWIW